MASNIVQCVLAVLVILHPSAFLFTCSAHLPNPMDNPTDDQVQEDSNNNSSGEESNIILLNNINKKIWDANSLAPDDIRCYCNLPACVSNGYMCRTARSHPDGGCFSERLQGSAGGVSPLLPARHGCTNMLLESKESFKCDNNHQTVNRRSSSSGKTTMTTVMCCHEDMCNHEGTDGKRATKSLQQLQQRIKLNQQRDVAAAAALTGKDLKNSSGNAAAVAAASTNVAAANGAKYNPSMLLQKDLLLGEGPVPERPDIVDSEYQFSSENEQQNTAIKTITCVVAVLGAICVFTLLYIGIRLLSNDSIGSSPSSKLNRSDDSGHIMISAASPEGKLLMIEPKYYIATNASSSPTMAATVYQPLSVQKNEVKCGDNKLSALDYHLLAPQLVSKLEKGGGSSGEDNESASDRLLKPMISGSSRTCNNNTNNNNNNNCRRNSNHNNNRMAINSACTCNLAKNCRNCSSTNVKFTNELWHDKDNRRGQ